MTLFSRAADSYLRSSNSRLLELREEYANFGTPAIAPSRWSRSYIESELPLRMFRADCAFVWQHRENGPDNYRLSTDHILKTSSAWLLDRLKEDGRFGAEIVTVNNLSVSRDLLDSVLEIAFIDRVLRLTSARQSTLLDIGAGYGRLGHRVTKAFSNVQVLCTDAVAESTFVCDYYLRYRRVASKARAIPLHHLQNTLRRTNIDLAINAHSFSECTLESIEWWLDLLKAHRVRYLFIVPNAVDHGGKELHSCEYGGEKCDYLPSLETRGYRRVACVPKYNDDIVQKYGVSPTYYHLFELLAEDAKPHVAITNTAIYRQSLQAPLYIPREIIWIDSCQGCVKDTGRPVSLYNDFSFFRLLSGWKHLASLDEAALSAIDVAHWQGILDDQDLKATWRSRCARFFISCVDKARIYRHRKTPNFRRARVALTELVAQGVFISSQDLLEHRNTSNTNERDAPLNPRITSVVLDAPDNSLDIEQAASDFLRRARQFGQSRKLFAISEGSSNCEQSALASDDPLSIIYIDSVIKNWLSLQIVNQGVPDHIAKFAVYGDNRIRQNHGADRNAALLLSAGECLMFAGQRAVDHISGAGIKEGLVFRGNASEMVRTVRLPRNNRNRNTDEEILQAHESVLGHAIRDLVREQSNFASIQLRSACGHMLESLLDDCGTIAVSLTSIAARCQHEKALVPGSRFFTVFHNPPKAIDSFAVDGRTILPPFWPCGDRNCRIFYRLLSRAHRSSFMCQLPWWALSAVDTPKQQDRSVISPVYLCFSDLIDTCLTSIKEPSPFAPSERLIETGQTLIDLANSSDIDLQGWLRVAILRRIGEGIRYWENQLEVFPKDIILRAGLEASEYALEHYSNPKAVPVPNDLVAENQRNPLKTIRDLLKLFGELLIYWPRIFDFFKAGEHGGYQANSRL